MKGFEMEVHPLAALFPMMRDDELGDLAADIKANGLIHPIVRDDNGVLIDGRNRLLACEMVGVEPTFVSLNGHDAAAFIVSANLNRREMTKGQKAMVLAMIYPEPERGRGKKDKAAKGAETASFSYRRVQEARTVLHHSRALADDVLSIRTTLDKALATVEAERQAGKSVDAKMAQLRAKAPDVADLVDEERLTLEAGIAEMRERQRRDEEAVDAAKQALRHLADIPVQVAMVQKGVALAGTAMLADFDFKALIVAVGEIDEMVMAASP